MTEKKLSGRVALVVGSGKGIGKAIAKELASEGATVVVTGIHRDKGLATTDEILAMGVQAAYVPLDVTDPAQCQNAVAETVAKFGKLDILVCNAGIGEVSTMDTYTLEQWDNLFTINLRSYFIVVKAALPHLMATGKGNIVLVSSLAAVKALRNSFAYGSAKSGVLHFARMLGLDYADKGVRVNAVAPGNIATDIITCNGQAVMDRLAAAIPMKRIGEPEEVAKVVKFLVSDDASYVTGQVISVAGGLDLT